MNPKNTPYRFWQYQDNKTIVKSRFMPWWGYPEYWFRVGVRQWRKYQRSNTASAPTGGDSPASENYSLPGNSPLPEKKFTLPPAGEASRCSGLAPVIGPARSYLLERNQISGAVLHDE